MKEYKGNTWISKNKIYRKKKYANKEKSIEKDYYYEKSIKELTEYMRNKLCRKIRKQINTENRKSKNAANKNKWKKKKIIRKITKDTDFIYKK